MDKALVKNSQDQINDEYRENQEHPQAFDRRLKLLRGALKTRADGSRESLARQFIDLFDGIAERHAFAQIE